MGSKSTFRPHIHDFYHLVLYTKGQGFYQFEGVYRPARVGTCVLTSPGQTHEFISRRDRSVYSEITFVYENPQQRRLTHSFEKLLSLYSGISISLPVQLQLEAEVQQLQNRMVRITDYLNSSSEQSLYQAHRQLAQIFNFLIDCSSLNPITSIINDRLQRVRSWIEEHYQQNISMDELARMAGISRGYFFRSFKKAFGVSPLAYQQSLRIEAAKTLLQAASLNCNEIALRTGFENVGFFHRVFRKHAGMTPLAYRKSR